MADIDHYVREDVRAFLDMLKQLGRPAVEELPVEEGRQNMRALGQLAEADARDLAIVQDLSCPGPAGEVPLRLFDTRDSRDPGPIVVFIHGGGFVIGDLDVYNNLCTELSYQLDLPVVAVDYRLAPEHPFPAAPDDWEAPARWIASSPTELGRRATGLVIIGDSAGGNLTIVTTNQLCADPAEVPVLVQAPLYPIADDVSQHRSLSDFAEGFLLTRSAMAFFSAHYAGDPKDPRHTPMAGDCSNTPPTVICAAGLDPLGDSGRNYAAHLIQQGIDVTYLESRGNIHGFGNLRKATPSGQRDLENFIAAIRLMLDRHSAGGSPRL